MGYVKDLFKTKADEQGKEIKSLIEQLADTQNEKKINVIIAFPFFFPGVVTGNSLQEIKVLDKNEKDHRIRR